MVTWTHCRAIDFDVGGAPRREGRENGSRLPHTAYRLPVSLVMTSAFVTSFPYFGSSPATR